MVTFERPDLIALGGVLAGLFVIGTILWAFLQNRTINNFGDRKLLRRFSSFTNKIATILVLSLSLGLLGIAAANPTIASNGNASTQTLNAVIVMDISRSMFAEDGFSGSSRLTNGMDTIKQLMDSYPDGLFGLVVYTNEVETYPPTHDHQAIQMLLTDIRTHYAVHGEGSEPITALQSAEKLIADNTYPIDTIILISDGGISLRPNPDRPDEDVVLGELKSKGIHLILAGVGGLVPAPIPYYEKGQLSGYYQLNGTTAYTSLDETALRRFAGNASGLYIHLAATDDLSSVVKSNHLDSQPTAQRTKVNLTWAPVALSIMLIAAWLLISFVRFPRFS